MFVVNSHCAFGWTILWLSHIESQYKNELFKLASVYHQETPGLVTWACDSSEGMKVVEGWFGWRGRVRWGWDTGSPVPSGEFESCDPTEGLGDVVPRVEGTAWGWIHRAAFTSRSLRWKDNVLVLHGPNDASSAAHNPTTTFSLFLFFLHSSQWWNNWHSEWNIMEEKASPESYRLLWWLEAKKLQANCLNVELSFLFLLWSITIHMRNFPGLHGAECWWTERWALWQEWMQKLWLH